MNIFQKAIESIILSGGLELAGILLGLIVVLIILVIWHIRDMRRDRPGRRR